MSLIVKREFMPDELKTVYVDFHWSQRKLWDLERPTISVEVSVLDWIVDYPIWYMDENPVPRSILERPELDPQHWSRIQAADLSYPIHVLRWKGRLLILDGIHRLMKAKISGLTHVNAKVLDEAHIPEILPTKEDFENGFLKQFKKSLPLP